MKRQTTDWENLCKAYIWWKIASRILKELLELYKKTIKKNGFHIHFTKDDTQISDTNTILWSN